MPQFGEFSSLRRMNRSVVTAALLLAACALACEEEFVVARGDAVLVVDPEAVDFGDAAVGVSYTADLELKNPGSVPLDIMSVTLSDSLAGEFTLSEIPPALGAGAKHSATLTFVPTSPGLREGTITFETDSPQEKTVVVVVKGRGVEPAIVASPATVDFGRVLVGRTVSATVALTNRSDRPVTLLRAMTAGTMEVTSSLARVELAPGASVDLPVSYAPTDVGPDTATITILDNSPRAEALAVNVRGEGVDTDIVVEPLSLSFSSLYVGETRTQPFFIRNIGDVDHDITELVFVSSNTTMTPQFSLTTTATAPYTILAGASMQVDVTYAPQNDTPHMDQVRVQATGAPQPIQVTINGNADIAPTPRVDVSPTSLAFGAVEVAQTRRLNLTVSNLGTADLTLSQDVTIEPMGTPYSVVNAPTSGTTLRPMDLSTFQVEFAPTQVGIAPAAEVVVRSNDPTTPTVRVPITGEGTMQALPAIFVNPNPIAFGGVPRGTQASRSVLVRNDGTAPLVLNLVRLTNNAGGRFTLPSPPAAMTSLNPGASTMFSVDYFDNGVVASYNGTLEIQSNDPGGNVNVPISATTDPPPPSLTDISITLTWPGMNHDVDLHLIRPGGGLLFDAPGDNCFCNTNPDWGVAGVPQDNPFLDRDDLFGPGPENINLSVAEDGLYRVVVHLFNDRGNGAVTPTVQIAIRGMVVATVSQPLTNNQYWTAGYISWNSVSQMGTWQPSTAAPTSAIISFCY